MTRQTAVIYVNQPKPDTPALNRQLAAAHDALHRRGITVTGTYVDLDDPPDRHRPGLEALIADQEARRAAPLIFVPSLQSLASRTDELFTLMSRLDQAGAKLIGPGFDRPISIPEEAK